jgi:hypothetical protein
MTPFWLCSFSGRRRTVPIPGGRAENRGVRPHLELLEGRCIPSVNLTVGARDTAGLISAINQANAQVAVPPPLLHLLDDLVAALRLAGLQRFFVQ